MPLCVCWFLSLHLLPVCHCPSQLKPERFEAAAKEAGFTVTMRMQVGTGGGAWACMCACGEQGCVSLMA